MDKLTESLFKLLKDKSDEYNIEELTNEENFFNLKKEIVRQVNNILNKEKPNKWQIRDSVNNLFKLASIDLEENNIEKLIFLLITDAINERIPSPSPLYFEYRGHIIPKRNAIITDFELFPELKEKVNQLNPEKKHILVFKIFKDGEIISKGVAYYLSVIDYLIFLFLDKALYEEVIDINKILKEKDGNIEVSKKDINFLIDTIFSGLYEFFSGEKERFKASILDKDYSKYFIKGKKLIKESLSDEKEKELLIKIAIEDEKLSENKEDFVKNPEVQENVFKEASERDVSNIDKIDAVVWLIGLNNLNMEIFFNYFSVDDLLKFLEDVEKDIETGKDIFKKSIKDFVENLLNEYKLYPVLKESKNLEDFIEKNTDSLKTELLFIKEQYNEFLEKENKKDINTEIKKLFAKYKTGQIDKKEFLNWLSLYETKEGINKNLIEFVKNGL